MNRTPEILAELRAAIDAAPITDLPAIIGQVEGLKAEAFARLVVPAAVSDRDDDAGDLLTAEQVAARLGDGYTSRWVRDNQAKLPRVTLPGRKLRFSAKRLETMIRKRSYG